MKIIKIAILTFAAAVLAGCSSSQGVPYAGGDVCEWAKQNLVAVQQELGDSLFFHNREKVRNAQKTVIASCYDGEEKDGAWACAEGHSCK